MLFASSKSEPQLLGFSPAAVREAAIERLEADDVGLADLGLIALADLRHGLGPASERAGVLRFLYERLPETATDETSGIAHVLHVARVLAEARTKVLTLRTTTRDPEAERLKLRERANQIAAGLRRNFIDPEATACLEQATQELQARAQGRIRVAVADVAVLERELEDAILAVPR